MPKKITTKLVIKRSRRSTIEISEKSKISLEELGITIEKEKIDYSLKTIADDKEFIKNPKILELDSYNRIENEYDKPDDKFPNEEDPFYNLDDKRELNEKFIQSRKANPLTVKLITIKMNSNSNLKQLKNTR